MFELESESNISWDVLRNGLKSGIVVFRFFVELPGFEEFLKFGLGMKLFGFLAL